MPRMSSSTMSLACLSEARSTIRRARRRASALSDAGVNPGSGATSEWLSMPATIAPPASLDGIEFVKSSDSLLASGLERQSRCGRIQESGAHGFVDAHFVLVSSALDYAEKHFANFAANDVNARQEQIASLAECARTGIDVDSRTSYELSRQFARRRRESPYRVDVRARLHRGIEHHGGWAGGTGRDDVRRGCLLGRSGARPQACRLGHPLRERAALVSRRTAYQHAFEVAHPSNRFDVEARLDTRAEHSQAAGRRRGQRACRDRRASRGADAREVAAVHERQRSTRLVLAQDVDRRYRRQAAGRIAAEDRDDFPPKRRRFGNGARHGQQHAVGTWRLDTNPQGRLCFSPAVGGERTSDRLDDRLEVE